MNVVERGHRRDEWCCDVESQYGIGGQEMRPSPAPVGRRREIEDSGNEGAINASWIAESLVFVVNRRMPLMNLEVIARNVLSIDGIVEIVEVRSN